jgi:hypothetical protein
MPEIRQTVKFLLRSVKISMGEISFVIDGIKTVQSRKYYIKNKTNYENINSSNYEELRFI